MELATPQKLAIPEEYKCNNDKAISPDGKLLGFSATARAGTKGSNVFLASADGTNIKQMTTLTPELLSRLVARQQDHGLTSRSATAASSSTFTVCLHCRWRRAAVERRHPSR